MTKTKKRITGQQAAKILGVTSENIRGLAKAGLLSTVLVDSGNRKTRYYFESEILARKNACKEYITLAEDTESVLQKAKEINQKAHLIEEDARKRLKQAGNWQLQSNRLCNILDTAITSMDHNGVLSDREKDILHRWIQLEPIESLTKYYSLTTKRITDILLKALWKLEQIKRLADCLSESEKNVKALERQNAELTSKLEYLKCNITTIKDENILVLSSEEYAIRNLLLSDITRVFYHYWGKQNRYEIENILREKGINTVADFVCKSAETIRSYGINPSDFVLTLDELGLYFGFNVMKYGIEDKETKNHIFTKSDEEMNNPEFARIKTLLLTRVRDLGLSVRSYNCLKAADIDTFADLCQLSENDLKGFRNFGRKSLYEISNLVGRMGLSFGMDIKKYGLMPKQFDWKK